MVPLSARRAQIETLKERGKRRRVDLDAGLAGEGLGRRKLERAAFQPFCQDTPAGPVKVDQLRELAPPAQEHVEMAIEWVHPQPTDRASERVEGPAHVHRLGSDEHADGGRKRQHWVTTRSSFTRTCESKDGSTSTLNCPACTR